jgi:hypothetical protein
MEPLPSRPTFIAAGAVVVPAKLAEPLWAAMRLWIRERERNGARVRSDVQDLVDALRLAALANSLAADPSGPEVRTSPDLDPPSVTSAGVLPTEVLAVRLGVSCRHARRVARAEGIAPVRRNCWAAEDVAALVARRNL